MRTAATFFIILAVGVAALLADRFRFFGPIAVEITWFRILAVALVATGVALSFRSG